MSMENKNLTDLTPAPRILPVTRSTPLPEKVQAERREVEVVDFYAIAMVTRIVSNSGKRLWATV
jgi:hypothetical protein